MLTCRVNNREAAPLIHTELIALLQDLDLIRYRSVVVKIASATKSNQLLRFDRKPEPFSEKVYQDLVWKLILEMGDQDVNSCARGLKCKLR